MNTHGVQSTKGHLANNGGLRGHSVGDIFPYMVIAKGPFDSLKWHVRKPNGELSHPYSNAHQAELAAKAALKCACA